MAGQRPLEPLIGVRIPVPQQIVSASSLYIKLYLFRLGFELLNVISLSGILELMPSKQTKKGSFSWKRVLLALITISLLIVLFVVGKYIISWKLYKYKTYKLNHLSKNDLPNVYTNDSIGYSFNYPKKANVYKWFGTEENSLRVFSDGDNQGSVCDIYVNDSQRYKPTKSEGYNVDESETNNYNGLSWRKWKDIDDTGGIFDRHFVSWYTEKGDNHAWITTIIETEGYCQSIVSTFRFTK